MKPGKLQRMISLFRFQSCHVIAAVHNSNVKMASGVSQKSKFESNILVLAVEFAVNLSNIVMAGDTCFMFGRGTSIKTTRIGNMEVTAKDEDHKKMEGRLAWGNYEDKRS